MSERTNSCIELSEIRTLDNLLTQCESSSCEYICKDCCEKLGSIENVEHQTDNRTTTDDDSVVIGCDGNNMTVKSDAQLSLDSDNGINLMKPLTTTIDDQHFNDAAVTSNCCRFCDANSVRSFSNQRHCSSEKESAENQLNDSVNCGGTSKGGSENTLVGKFRKHCSIKCDEKPNHIPVKACFKCDKLMMSKACSNGQVGEAMIVSPTQKRIMGRSKSAKEHKSTEKSISTKTSRDSMQPLKRRVDIGCGDIDKDTSVSLKDSKISLPLLIAKKMSVKNHHCSEELSLETLLGVHHEIKIPEPVEAVCID